MDRSATTPASAALPTISYLLENGAAIILMSHLGRPKGGPDPKFSMKVTADHLATLINARQVRRRYHRRRRKKLRAQAG